jgi:hypothetical protein
MEINFQYWSDSLLFPRETVAKMVERISGSFQTHRYLSYHDGSGGENQTAFCYGSLNPVAPTAGNKNFHFSFLTPRTIRHYLYRIIGS